MLLPADVRILTASDLTRAWRTLRGALRCTAMAVWVLAIDEDGLPAQLHVLAGLPDGPYDLRAEEARALYEELSPPRSSAAFLYTRPGGGPWHLDDRAWVRFLTSLADPTTRQWAVHRARDAVIEAA